MKPEPENSATSRAVERDAAAWVVREERGLTPAEQDALSQWLAADPRHGPALRDGILVFWSRTEPFMNCAKQSALYKRLQIARRVLEHYVKDADEFDTEASMMF